MFEELSEGWQMELETVRNQLQALHLADEQTVELGIGLLELATLARKRWKTLDRRQQRDLLFTLRSNSRLCSDGLKVTWRIPFNLLPQSPYALERDEAVFSEENGLNSKWLQRVDDLTTYFVEDWPMEWAVLRWFPGLSNLAWPNGANI